MFFAFARARRMEAVPLHRSEQYNGLAPRDCAAWMRFSGMGVEQTAHLGFIASHQGLIELELVVNAML
jgi:hypothetical protein